MLLAKYLGGSHLYSLNGPDSDVDKREIFLNTDPAYILGTKRFDQKVINTDKEDSYEIELRRFFELTKKGNTQSVEVLSCKEDSFIFIHPIVVEMRKNKSKVIDSEKLFKVASAFIHAQKYLIFNDKRKAEEGSKRFNEIEKYGYVPKAAVTALRIAISTSEFFNNGTYKVEVDSYPLLSQIKFRPSDFSKENIYELVEQYDTQLKTDYDNTTVKNSFDEEWVNNFLLKAYLPHLK